MASIAIEDKGFYTTIQDQGRLGYTALGVPESGAMDQQALALSNLLWNNPEGAAALECTLVGPTIRFLKELAFVLTGAQTAARLDEEAILGNKVYLARKDQVLSIGKVTKGCRVYLGVEGGLSTDSYMESRSQFYPITPQPTVEKGMQLATGMPNFGSVKGVHLHPKQALAILGDSSISVEKGPEFNLLAAASRKQLWNAKLSITSWNRMGIVLDPILQAHHQVMQSSPVLPGTVQLTPSGRLFVLMRDCQTTGGYPRVLQLTQNGMNRLAQKKYGDRIQLCLV